MPLCHYSFNVVDLSGIPPQANKWVISGIEYEHNLTIPWELISLCIILKLIPDNDVMGIPGLTFSTFKEMVMAEERSTDKD